MTIAALLLIAATPAESPVDRLAWLSGDWVSESGDRWSEEQWNEPRGGLMLGVGRSGKAERATSFEFMRITVGPGGVVTFWGAPGGAPAVSFKLVQQGASNATFANPQHDFPKRISYRRDGDQLVATVMGDDPADTQSWTYRRRLPADASRSKTTTGRR